MKTFFAIVGLIIGTHSLAESVRYDFQQGQPKKKQIFSYDVQTAYNLIGGERSIGHCVLNVTMFEVQPSHRRLRATFEYTGDDGAKKIRSFDFSNHESNRSQIRTEYEYLGFGQAKTVILERIDISNVPATKYRFIIGIDEGVPVSLRLERIFGWTWNTPGVVDCHVDE